MLSVLAFLEHVNMLLDSLLLLSFQLPIRWHKPMERTWLKNRYFDNEHMKYSSLVPRSLLVRPTEQEPVTDDFRLNLRILFTRELQKFQPFRQGLFCRRFKAGIRKRAGGVGLAGFLKGKHLKVRLSV